MTIRVPQRKIKFYNCRVVEAVLEYYWIVFSCGTTSIIITSVADPDTNPPDLQDFGLPGSSSGSFHL
jgi:hypothetical protein